MSVNNLDSIFGNGVQRVFDEGLDKSGLKITPGIFKDYEDKILSSQPALRGLLDDTQDISFFDYTKNHIRENKNPLVRGRKNELQEAMYQEVVPLLGVKIAESVKKQIKGNNSVSTIQHSVPLGHPYTLSSTLQAALPYFGADYPNLQNIIVLASSQASFNNYMSPKADALHVLSKDPIEFQQFNLFGQTSEASCAIFHKPYDLENIDQVKKKALQLRQDSKITKQNFEDLVELIDSVYASPHVLSQKDYCNQLTVLNYYLFSKITAGYKKSVPNLIFLSQELLVLRLLVSYHMNSESVLHTLLFDERARLSYEKEFDGITGAFNSQDGTGTFLFWAMPKGSKQRQALKLKNGFLESLETGYRVKLSSPEIEQAIRNNELIPSTSLVFIVLAFYYGLFLQGGLAQVTMLSEMKTAYRNVLQEMGFSEEKLILDTLNTSNMLLSKPAFLFTQKAHKRIPLTGFDILVYGKGKIHWEELIEATKKVSFRDVFSRTYPFHYLQYVNREDSKLASITEADIEEYLHLDAMPALFEV